MAARFHGDPSRHLVAVAVTGTNGKTSVTYLLEAIWKSQGIPAGVVGTISYRYGGHERPAALTTPEALDLHAELAAMVKAGVECAAVEVSSHALALGRVGGCHWDAAVFTNLSHDHLDFHGDLETYFSAKASLFLDHLSASSKPDPVAVINADDPFGVRLARQVRCRVVTFGRDPSATVHPLALEQDLSGIRGTLSVAGESMNVVSPLIGEQHVFNIMAAVAAAHGIGVPRRAVEVGITACTGAPGRLERVTMGRDFTVFVDYAHTPHALESALATLRTMCPGRILTVFGCGGDRDRAKRPLMGEIAGRLSDVVVLTSDNPRTEEPNIILAEIERGIEETCLARVDIATLVAEGRGYTTDPDRRGAIGLALKLARSRDIVLIAGKGHEDYQIIGTERRPFDDREEVRRLLGETS